MQLSQISEIHIFLLLTSICLPVQNYPPAQNQSLSISLVTGVILKILIANQNMHHVMT